MSNSSVVDFIESYEALRREERDIKRRQRETLAAAEEAGHDVGAIKQFAKDRDKDPADVAAKRIAYDRLRKSIGDLAGTELGDWCLRLEAAHVAARKRGNTKATKEGTTLAA